MHIPIDAVDWESVDDWCRETYQSEVSGRPGSSFGEYQGYGDDATGFKGGRGVDREVSEKWEYQDDDQHSWSHKLLASSGGSDLY